MRGARSLERGARSAERGAWSAERGARSAEPKAGQGGGGELVEGPHYILLLKLLLRTT